MAMEKQLGWLQLLLIFTALPCCSTLQVSIPVAEYEVARDGDITMTCSFVPARPVANNFVLSWEAYPDTDGAALISVATYFLNSPVDIAPSYEGRASLEVDINNQLSTLRLTKVTMQDNRHYQCSVKIPGDDEGTTAASTSLLVLVAPSPPICILQGKAEYFHNVTLTCKSEEGSPQPAYEWKSYSVNNIPRAFPPKAVQKDGALSLFNISRETSGFYICTSTNRIGSASCNFTLSVVPSSMNIGSTAGIIGGVVAGFLLLGILVYCCCRKKGKKDKYAEGTEREMEFHDRDAPEAGELYWDEKKQVNQYEDKDTPVQNSYSQGPVGTKFDEDQHSYNSGKERPNGKGSDAGSQHRQDNQHDGYRGDGHQRDNYRGSRDHLDDQRDNYRGSRDRLDDHRDNYRGSRDHLDNHRDNYRGSRDRLDDHRNNYRGSRDRLDDQRDNYRGSRDRLDDQRNNYRGSRDRLDDQHQHYRGSRDHLDNQRERYGGSRDRLDDQRERYDQRDHYQGSRDRLDDQHDHYHGSQYE